MARRDGAGAPVPLNADRSTEATSSTDSGELIELLVVGWYPAADDPFAGRFIADQASALAATGRVRPSIVSFEPFWLHGDLRLRSRAAAAWPPIVAARSREGGIFAGSGAHGPAGIPVARLGTAAGRAAGAGRDNEAVHRARALGSALSGVRQRPWRLVHAHVGYPEGAAAADVARSLGLPLVLTEHATYLDRLFGDPVIRGRYRQAARGAARLIAVGRVLAQRIEREFPELLGRVTVIPNTVDVEAFLPIGPEERDPDELLWVGYRRAVKGMETLLRAFALVRVDRPSTKLRLVGRSTSEEEEDGWRRLAAELGVVDAVRFDPPADRAGVAAAMARAACFVHPGTIETMGIVAVEALASGLPVVATDSGGVTEVLGDDPSAVGALVRSRDPGALAAAILATLERRRSFDPAELRRSVVERYGAQPVAARLVALYDEVLAEHDRGAPGSRRKPAGVPARFAEIPEKPAAPTVLVAFDRPALDRALARFPAWVVNGVVAVSRGTARDVPIPIEVIPPALDSALAAFLGWPGRLGGAGLRGRLLALPRWPIRAIRRRRLERRLLPILSAAVERALDRVGARPDRPAWIVCLGGIDVVVGAAVAGGGRAAVAPGGLRWLGDARWRPDLARADDQSMPVPVEAADPA